MKTLSLNISEDNLSQKLDEIESLNPNLICLFFPSEEVKKRKSFINDHQPFFPT